MFLCKSVKLTKNIIFLFSVFIVRSIFSEGFIEGTLVKTQNGYVPIEQLKEGNYIASYSFKEKNLTNGKILKITKRHYKKCFKLTISGQEIIAAPDHKFFCPLKKGCWLKAQDIQKNDFVLKEIKDLVRIDDIIQLDQENDFYCLSIEKSHNYFVSENNVFVHNVVPVVAGLYALGAAITATFEFEFSVALFGIATYSYGSYKNNQAAKDIGKSTFGTGLFVIAGKKLTGKESKKKAEDWNYFPDKTCPHNTHGAPAYKKKGKKEWISPDQDNHGGSEWKIFDKNGRTGSLDANGKKIRK
jgi:hypothetical protein